MASTAHRQFNEDFIKSMRGFNPFDKSSTPPHSPRGNRAGKAASAKTAPKASVTSTEKAALRILKYLVAYEGDVPLDLLIRQAKVIIAKAEGGMQ